MVSECSISMSANDIGRVALVWGYGNGIGMWQHYKGMYIIYMI